MIARGVGLAPAWNEKKKSNNLPGKGIQYFWNILRVRIAEFVKSELAATNLLAW